MKDRFPLLLLLLLVGLWQPPAWAQAIDRETLQRQAEQGNAKAQTELGYLYHTGEGVERDYAEAVKWYRLAAEQDDPDAQYNLGVAYAFGEGVEIDLARASDWYRRAAEQGHRVAAFSLGLSYLHGDGVQRDAEQAAGWFRQAAKQGYTRAQVHLASLYHTGEGIPRDYEAAAYWYRQAAERGAAIAQYNLGNLYHTGHGVPQDDDEALHWFRRAAQQEHALAKAQLETFGQRTQPAETEAADAAIPASPGGTPSPGAPATGGNKRIVSPPLEAAESVDLDAEGRAEVSTEAPTEQSPAPADTATVANEPASSGFANMTAADRQQPDAGDTTGTLPAGDQAEQTAAEQTATETTRTTVPDNSEWQEPVAENDAADERATDQPAADDGQKESIAALEDSPPVQPDISISEAASAALAAEDYAKALCLLQVQALNGNAAAETRLGEMYFQGRGVEQNRDRAFLWYRRAAKRNYADAQFNLGNMYLHGEGVLQDDDKAREWYAKAAAQGHQAAATNLANISRRQAKQQRYNPENHGGPTQQEMEAAVDASTPATSDTAADIPPPARRLISPPLEAQTETDAEPAGVNNEISPEMLLENTEQSSQRIITPPLEDTSD